MPPGATIPREMTSGPLAKKPGGLTGVANSIGNGIADVLTWNPLNSILPGPTSKQVVGASMYGGPSDPSTPGDLGAANIHLTGKMAWAELGDGHALGGLPMHTKLKITYKGRSVVAERLDTGHGGGPVKGHERKIDLWWQTAEKLNFSGLDLVEIETTKGPITAATDAVTGAIDPSSNAAGGFSDPATATADALKSLVQFFATLISMNLWLTLGKMVLGAVLIIMGFRYMVRGVDFTGKATRAARTAGDAHAAARGAATKLAERSAEVAAA